MLRLLLTVSALLIALGPSAGAQSDARSAETGEWIPDARPAPAAADVPEGMPEGVAGETLTLLARLPEGETRGIALRGSILFRSNGGLLEALDMTDPTAPVRVGRVLAERGVVQGVALDGTLAYVPVARGVPFATRGSMLVVDAANPAAMQIIGEITGRSFFEAQVRGGVLFGAAAGGGLRTFNVATPSAPAAGGFVTVSGGSVLSIALNGTTAYLAAGNAGLAVVNLDTPLAPSLVSAVPLGGFATRVLVQGDRLYVTYNDGGLVVFSLASARAPVELGRVAVASPQVRSVAVSGTTAYVGRDNGLSAFDVSNPAAITPVGQVNFGVTGSGQSVVLDGPTAYVGNRFSGVRVVDTATLTERALIDNGGFSFKVSLSEGIVAVSDLVGQVRFMDVRAPTTPLVRGRVRGIRSASGAAFAGPRVFVADREDDGTSGLTEIDASDLDAPVRVGTRATGGAAFGVDVMAATAFVANGYGQVPGGPGSLIAASLTQTPPAVVGEAAPGNQAFGVRAVGGRAYVATFGSGLSIFDVSNPAAMAPLSLNAVGAFSSDVEVVGSVAYLADSEFGSALALSVVDVSNPAVPVRIGTADGVPSGSSVAVAVGNDYAYTAVDFVGIYQNDVSNPAAPARRAVVTTSDRATGVAAEGRVVVVADAGAGLWIFESAARTSGEAGPTRGRLGLRAGPNPLRGDLRLVLHLPEAALVRVEVLDALGRRVATYPAGVLAAGASEVVLPGSAWPAGAPAAGVYSVRVTAGPHAASTRVTVAR